MRSCVILLRGINVGGKNRLPMAELRSVLSDLGCENVSTYIQSGNAVCQFHGKLEALSAQTAAAIEKKFKFELDILTLDGTLFQKIAGDFPFVAEDPKCLHTWFLKQAAVNADTERLRELASPTEEFELTPRAFYLHAPEGIGRSRLAAGVEKCLGVPCTARNNRTTAKLCELLDSL